MLNTCFPSGHFVHAKQRVPTWQAPINVGCWISNGPPRAKIPHTCCCILTGDVCSVWPLMGRREHKEAWAWTPSDSTCVFLLYEPLVYPYYFAVINLSHEYNYMLSPMSLTSEWPLGVVLGISTHPLSPVSLSVKQQGLCLLHPCNPQRIKHRSLQLLEAWLIITL